MSPEQPRTTQSIQDDEQSSTSLADVQDQYELIRKRRKSHLKGMSKGDLIRLVEAMDPFVGEYHAWAQHYQKFGSDFGDWLAHTHGETQ